MLTFTIIMLKGVIFVDRKEIKEEAKAKIKGNIWNIIWPLLVIGVVSSILSTLFGGNVTFNYSEAAESINARASIGSGVVAIISGFLSAGYIKYLINFVRTGKFNTNDIINTVKEKWLHILIAEILVGVIVTVCSLLLVVPGIIMALAYTFALYLVVDKDSEGSESLKQSREMMKGYKWDYFVFGLSFLGWIILGIFTLGILYIWLIPYMNVANILYYERLIKKTSK